ncbi:hypothetical protein OROGR_022558 [Orobanche gracilis]
MADVKLSLQSLESDMEESVEFCKVVLTWIKNMDKQPSGGFGNWSGSGVVVETLTPGTGKSTCGGGSASGGSGDGCGGSSSDDTTFGLPWAVKKKSLKVLLVCGSDLLASFSIPGFWVRDQVETICRDFGLVCIRRGCQDVESVVSKDDILNKYKKNITIVDEVVPNGISSTGLRDCISRGLSVKYLTADEVIDYIKQNGLYMEQNEDNPH